MTHTILLIGIWAFLLVATTPATGGPVPPLARVASPFAAVASSCPEGTCSWTWDTEEFCYDSGTVINTPSCALTCECGSWRVDC